ncbi:RNA-binding domain-containing protein [Micromonospora sp. LOL_013]|uniref:RNA-binding domain-containing protein n=1 Tax=Micromonospora sp. LOL_013 TaxID=3345414 RepID=UPI003A84F9A4
MPPNLDRYREAFFGRFPEAANLDRALRTSTNRTPLFFFYESKDPDLKKCWLVLGRLGQEMEASFSINGEVLLLFSPYDDFQRRAFNKLLNEARKEIAEAQRNIYGTVRFTPDSHLALISSRDPALDRHIKAWNADKSSSLVASIPGLDGGVDSIISTLRKSIATVLGSRDLYGGKDPVSGRDFFGRIDTIQAVSADLRSGRSVGLFGLRRSGKTSLLRELQFREESTGLALIVTDLESVDSIDDIPRQISQDLVNALRVIRQSRPSIWLGPESDHEVATFGALSARLSRVARQNAEILFVVAIDEVENLRRLKRESPDKVRLFLGALRRAAQTSDNLSLFFTGLTTEFFDQSMISDEIDNPLFGFVDSHYLPPFSQSESAELVRELGVMMMLDWSPEALASVHRYTGGFPFFVRDLASAVRKQVLDEQPQDSDLVGRIEVQERHVDSAYSSWTDDAGKKWSEILRSLASYHFVMVEMLRAKSEHEMNEWRGVGVEGDAAVSALWKLGFIHLDNEKRPRWSDNLIALNSLGAKAELRAADLKERLDLRQLLAQSESACLEFKSTARWNLHSGKKDSAIEDAILKTVAAFLNSDGGTLIVGVDDNGGIRGIAEDLQTFRGSLDQYERWLMGSLLSDRIGTEIVSQYVRFKTVNLDPHIVVVLEVARSESLVWASIGSDDALYVRNGNETRQLTGRKIVEFAQLRK